MRSSYKLLAKVLRPRKEIVTATTHHMPLPGSSTLMMNASMTPMRFMGTKTTQLAYSLPWHTTPLSLLTSSWNRTGSSFTPWLPNRIHVASRRTTSWGFWPTTSMLPAYPSARMIASSTVARSTNFVRNPNISSTSPSDTSTPEKRAVVIRPSVLGHRETMSSLGSNKPPVTSVKKVEMLIPITSGKGENEQQIEIPTFSFTHIDKSRSNPLPTVIYSPGSAWIADGLKPTQYICAKICELTGYKIIAVFPRLAPEHRFPIPILDNYEVTKHFKEFHHDYGIDGDNIISMGYSSGAYLTGQTSLLGADDSVPTRMQILASPIADLGRSILEHKIAENKDTAVSEEFVLWAIQKFLPQYVDPSDPKASFVWQPLDVLAKMPITHLIFGEYDRCFGDSRVLADRLKEAKTPSHADILPKENHGHWWHNETSLKIAADSIKEAVRTKYRNFSHRLDYFSSNVTPKAATADNSDSKNENPPSTKPSSP